MRSEEIDFFNTSALTHTHGALAHTHTRCCCCTLTQTHLKFHKNLCKIFRRIAFCIYRCNRPALFRYLRCLFSLIVARENWRFVYTLPAYFPFSLFACFSLILRLTAKLVGPARAALWHRGISVWQKPP